MSLDHNEVNVPPTKQSSWGRIRIWVSKHSRPWWWWVAGIIVALLVGIGIGGAANSGQDEIDALNATVDKVTAQRNAAREKLDSRSAQRRANEAKVAAEKADQEKARRQAQEAAEKAQREAQEAAQRQAQQQAEAQAQAAAAEAAKNTIDGDGVYAIGPEKNPGRYHRDANGESCYYAVLNSPDTTNISTNNITEGPAFVDLAAGKFFETTRCGTWTRVG